jgi:hypothetical protein
VQSRWPGVRATRRANDRALQPSLVIAGPGATVKARHTTSEVLVLGDRTRSSELALHVAGQARAPGPCESWRGTVDARLLSIGEIDRLRAKGSLW